MQVISCKNQGVIIEVLAFLRIVKYEFVRQTSSTPEFQHQGHDTEWRRWCCHYVSHQQEDQKEVDNARSGSHIDLFRARGKSV
jgi:hypothetical protein